MIRYTEKELRIAFEYSCKFSTFEDFKQFILDMRKGYAILEEAKMGQIGKKFAILGIKEGDSCQLVENHKPCESLIIEDYSLRDYYVPKIEPNTKFYDRITPKSQSKYSKKYRK